MRMIIRRHAVALALLAFVAFGGGFVAFHHAPQQPRIEYLPDCMGSPQCP